MDVIALIRGARDRASNSSRRRRFFRALPMAGELHEGVVLGERIILYAVAGHTAVFERGEHEI